MGSKLNKKIVSGITLTLLLLSMLTLAFNIQSVKAEPRTWTVDDDGPADFSSIQEAVNAVNLGDIIFVKEGLYYENVVVNKTVSLIGENKHNTVIDGNGTDNGVHIKGRVRNATITNFSIRNSGILVEGSGENNINHNIMTNGRFGILLRCDKNNLTGNIVSNFIHGIQVLLSDENVLINNTVSDNNAGIVISYSDNNTLISNSVLGNIGGITLGDSDENVLVNNICSSNGWEGIRLAQNCNGNLLLNNTASNNLDGFDIGSSDNNTLVNNIASNNKRTGIFLGRANNNVLVSNRVANNVQDGITVQEYSSNNTIYHNNVIGNTLQVYILLSPLNTMWDDGYPSGGNHWSDYTGVDNYSGPYQNDTGSDGIGDTPYVIDEENQDNYPLIEPWSPKPSNPVEAIQELIETIETWKLTRGTENSLKAKLKAAIHMLDLEKEDGAIQKLAIFVNKVEMLRERTLTSEQADNLVIEAQSIIDLIKENVNHDAMASILDAVILSNAFGSTPESSKWNSACDLYEDGAIDIFDAIILSNNFGEEWI